MSGLVKELNATNLKSTIASGVVLVDFWAPWCVPCQTMGPVLESVAASIGEGATVAKFNVDGDSGVAAEYGVMNIPTLILFRGGEELKRFVGVQGEDTLSAAIEDALA